MQNIDEHTITQAVMAANAECSSPRLAEIMRSLVQHLHDLTREVKLTEEEWAAGIQFLTDVGHICDARRQEFILLSDTLGLSMLVIAMNNRKPIGCTEATVVGPFFVDGAPVLELGGDVANGARGEPCFVTGRVLGLDGESVPHARINVWQADAEGFYDVQRQDIEGSQGRGILTCAADGRFHFRSIVAESYPIPHDGPVGRMLQALGRHPWRPAHLHFMIHAPGYEPLITHIFRRGDKYLDSDAVFGVRSSLIADWSHHEPGIAPDGSRVDTPFSTLTFEFTLKPLLAAGIR